VYPELLHLGPVTIYSFGVMAALALVGAVTVGWLVMRTRGVPFDFAYELLFAAGIGGFAGARLYYMFQHWTDVRADFWNSLVGGAGFTWYGGLAGGFLAVFAWSVVRKVPVGLVANAAGPGVAVGYAIGRIGCQLSGDGDYGKPSDLPWAMGYPHGTVPTPPGVTVHPTPVYETLVMFGVFALLYWMAKRPRPGWYVFGWFLVLQGVERFLIEELRLNPVLALGLTTPQFIGIASALAGIVVILVTRRRPTVEWRMGLAEVEGFPVPEAQAEPSPLERHAGKRKNGRPARRPAGPRRTTSRKKK
jgi:phosphatidylglycerol:prolipoprotein diacylglycerol transferase